MTATHLFGDAAPVGAVIPPAPIPPARAHRTVTPLREFIAQAGLELLGFGGALEGAGLDDFEVYGICPAGADGKPDMARAVRFSEKEVAHG